MERVLQVEKVSKYYRLGAVNSDSLKSRMHEWWTRTLGFQKNKTNNEEPWQGESETSHHIWALRNISFELNQGDVLGFVGDNGAGKSTLLKILARITTPTKGSVRGKGRIASLLEVGTGFHPELSGRENIFLNGQILGMKKKEIESKFDEIVAFSGVERFLDTPVKRYSSGMYVRLAFAVAAHLDSEILIVDEALAVGDENFQRKCLTKMREVSTQEGKTVLFVSHNLIALQNLCTKAIYLDKGQLADIGKPDKVISNYLKNTRVTCLSQAYDHPECAPGNEHIRIKKVEICPIHPDGGQQIDTRTTLDLEFEFWYNKMGDGDVTVGIQLYNLAGDCIFDICSGSMNLKDGMARGGCTIPGNFLNDGSYYMSLSFVRNSVTRLYSFEACLSFEVEDFREQTIWQGKWLGYVRPKFDVLLEQPVNQLQNDGKILSLQHSAPAA
ncbi:MAG: ABC transporter ATP-binding protein [Sphingobacteriales bacterium]|nr:MAG: ABC transporter ATP-binding protein [Sphingobacteriales bacterium]